MGVSRGRGWWLVTQVLASLSLYWCAGLATAALAQEPPATSEAVVAVERTVDLKFRDLGLFEPVTLRGVDGQASLPFGVRLDELITAAHLQLRFAYSPAMLQELSHIKVLLNGAVVKTLPLPRTQAGAEVVEEIDLDPRYFTDFNRLNLQLIGHYTLECENSMHSSLWATISNDSVLSLKLRPLGLKTDLALLPAPFFDRRDNRRLELPMLLPAKPSLEVLQAAGVVASWFGAQASYRSAHFPLTQSLPARHAVVFATNDARPAGMDLAPVQLPTVSMIANPAHPALRMLLVQGRDAAQLRTAAEALVLGQLVMSGPSATVSSVHYEPRLAYDAPNWVRTDRPVKLGELVENPQQLEAKGHIPEPLRVNVNVPPDLLTWNQLGVPLDLRYRYTPPAEKDNSVMTVSINDDFIRSYRLDTGSQKEGESRLLVPLFNRDEVQQQRDLVIPAFKVGINNQLQFQFVIDYHKSGLCKDSLMDVVHASIDPDSTIDLTSFPHYTAMPNLALFANAGFPFSKYADLAQTVLVLPDSYNRTDVESLLFLLGRMGRHTGIAAMRFRLTTAKDLKPDEDADLIVIGASSGRDLLAEWGANLPFLLDRSRRTLKPGLTANWLPRELFANDAPTAAAKVVLDSPGPLAALLAFESPLKAGRSVVAIAASASEQMPQALTALEDDGLVSNVRGDTVLVRDRNLASFRLADTYHVGHLPWLLGLWLFLSAHPLLVVLIGLIAGVLLAFGAYNYLKRVATRRLAK